MKRLQTAAEVSHKGYPRLIEHHNGAWRIRARAPLLLPLFGQTDDTHELAARAAFESYQLSLPEERRMLLDRDLRLGWDRTKYSREDAAQLNDRCRAKEGTLADGLRKSPRLCSDYGEHRPATGRIFTPRISRRCRRDRPSNGRTHPRN